MKVLLKTLTIIFSLSLLVGCSDGITVTSDFDNTANFEEYKTFGFLPWPEKNEAIVNDINKKRILGALEKEFKARGMTMVNGPEGDIAINVFVTAEQKTETQAYTNYYNNGYGYYYSPYMGMGGGASTTTVRDVNYVMGTVIVDVFEVSGKKLIWQGIGQGVVNETSNAAKKDANVDYAVAKILKSYPVAKSN